MKECLEEKERKWGKGREGKWPDKKEGAGGEEEKEGLRGEEEDLLLVQRTVGRMREKEKRERRKKIESRYSKEYKNIRI